MTPSFNTKDSQVNSRLQRKVELLRVNQHLHVMNDGSSVSHQYTFATSVDLASALETLQTQYLDVGETRALIIFNTAILNLECSEGVLTNLETAEIAVYEFPYNTNTAETEEEALSLVERFVEKVASVADTTASRQT